LRAEVSSSERILEAHKCSSQDQKKQEKQEDEEDDSNKGFITYFLEKVFGIK
jgi:hypothetical protein